MIDSVSSFDPQAGKPSSSESGSRRIRSSLFAATILLLVLIIVVPPFININRFRRSIVHSISAGLGRPVEASSVELQLFPRPGFVLHHLTIAEDPAFGAEPVMTAETVTAGLRASTLWHRRVEIATLRFDTPSVNLVRNSQGRWNFESLFLNSPVVRTHSTTAASEPMSFPYVEATEARINFKLGAEKLPFSLQRANLAFWRESSHEWRVRIRARPVRTDLSVADAGEIRGSGTLISTATLANAPIYLRLEWRRVQLGEITRLLHGEDEGWRGTVDWTARAIGTLSDISLTSDVAVVEFRRAEFVPSAEMDISAHCAARYVRNKLQLDSLQCSAPLGTGQLQVRGMFPGAELAQTNLDASLSRPPKKSAAKTKRISPATIQVHAKPVDSTSLQITLRQTPAAFFLDLLRHIHPGVAQNASVSGEMNGKANCVWRGLNTFSACSGNVQSTDVRLRLPNLEKPLAFSPVQLISSQAAAPTGNISASHSASAVWKLFPSHVLLGGPSAATLTGVLTSSGSLLQLRGPADLNELNKLAQALKIPAFSGEIESIHGNAQLALSMRSFWLPQTANSSATGSTDIGQRLEGVPAGFVPSQWTGTFELLNATLHLAALPIALQLASAQVDVLPGGIQWNVLGGTIAHIPFDGSFRWQIPCLTARSACARSFRLHTASLNVTRLQAALVQSDNSSNLLNLINSWTGNSPELPEVTGILNADVLSAGKISMKNAVLKFEIKGHQARLLEIFAKIFHGNLSGEKIAPTAGAPSSGSADQADTGSVQWGDGAPVYVLRLTLQHIQPDSVAAIWREHWGPGTANLKIDMKTRGWSASDLAQNANGKFSFVWLNGGLSPSDMSSAMVTSAEKFQQWDATGIIRDHKLVLGFSQIIPHSGYLREQILFAGRQSVSGTINFSRALDLRLQPSGISIKGPISKPTISAPDEPETAKPQAQDQGQ